MSEETILKENSKEIRTEGFCMDCGEKITKDDGNSCWNICNGCRESVQ